MKKIAFVILLLVLPTLACGQVSSFVPPFQYPTTSPSQALPPNQQGPVFLPVVENSVMEVVEIESAPEFPEPEVISTGVELGRINFSYGREIKVTFKPEETSEINVEFVSQSSCEYFSRNACVYFYRSGETNVIHVVAHSGVPQDPGGEAENLRNMIEGSGIWSATKNLDEIQEALDKINNGSASTHDGENSADNLRVESTRIPPLGLETYYKTYPSVESLNVASGYNSRIAEIASMNSTLLVVETCGWRVPGEAGNRPDAFWSVYIFIIY